MSPASVITHLDTTGAAVYGITEGSQPVARMGITSKGRLWFQLGQAPHVTAPADGLKAEGAGWSLRDEANDRNLYFVHPEDADDWELGEIITRLGTDRESTTRESLIELLGEDA